MIPEYDTLIDALQRAVDYRPQDMAVDIAQSPGAAMALAYRRDDGSTVARLFVVRGEATVYRVPSSVPTLAAMERLHADPAARATLTVV